MTAVVKPVASDVGEPGRRPSKLSTRLTIRPLLGEHDPKDDMVCDVLGAPDSERFAKNLKAFRERWPTEYWLYRQG